MKINLFSAMRGKLAVNDERIAQERTKMSLQMLRFIQCVLVVTQLMGIVLGVVFPGNDTYRVSPFVYLLIIFPFIVEPMLSCINGTLGTQKNDSAFFIVGIIEAGYFVLEIAFMLGLAHAAWLILPFVSGMAAYYTICMLVYNLIGLKRSGMTDDEFDNDT